MVDETYQPEFRAENSRSGHARALEGAADYELSVRTILSKIAKQKAEHTHPITGHHGGADRCLVAIRLH